MALAAFAVRSGEETMQMQVVCLDDLVAADDDFRRDERLVDWDHVRETARPFYRAGGAGRHGIDPAVFAKPALVLGWRGLPSWRETLRVAATDVSIRRFLGFGLTERLPDHSTFSHAQTKRFADSSVFEQLFTAVLRQCVEAGLVGGRRLVVDATHIEADAALKSLRADLASVDRGDGDGEMVPTPSTRRGRRWRWRRRATGRRRRAPLPTRRRFRAPIRMQSCATSRGIARIWCTAGRSPWTHRPG